MLWRAYDPSVVHDVVCIRAGSRPQDSTLDVIQLKPHCGISHGGTYTAPRIGYTQFRPTTLAGCGNRELVVVYRE